MADSLYDPKRRSRLAFAVWILVYVFFCEAHEFYKWGYDKYYGFLWVCTVSMVLAGIGLLLDSKTVFATGFLLAVPGHLIFQLDAVFWYLSGQFPMQLSTDLSVESTFVAWFIALHHFWFLPSCIVLLIYNGWKPTYAECFYSFLACLALRFASVLYMPKRMPLPRGGHLKINVNLVHGVADLKKAAYLGWFFTLVDESLTNIEYNLVTAVVCLFFSGLMTFLIRVTCMRHVSARKVAAWKEKPE